MIFFLIIFFLPNIVNFKLSKVINIIAGILKFNKSLESYENISTYKSCEMGLNRL